MLALGKRDADHLVITNASFISVSSQTPSQSYFPIEKKKKKTPPMRKSRQTEHPHMNFRRLAASDVVTPAFLPRVSQIKQPYGEHAALCSDARHGPTPRGKPAETGCRRTSCSFLTSASQEGSSPLPQADIESSLNLASEQR